MFFCQLCVDLWGGKNRDAENKKFDRDFSTVQMINFAELNKELEKKEYIEKLYQVFGIYFVYWTQMT